MHRTRIKFCGVTRAKDAAAAAVAGADAIGLIFSKRSQRCVTLADAKEILRALPPMVSPIGLFVDAPHDEVRDIGNALNLRTVQLHGNEPPEVVAQLRDFSVVKAVHCDAQNLSQILQTWRSAAAKLALTHLAGLLLESANTGQPGGSGIENDWSGIASVIGHGQVTGLPPLIAAGGLTPENVGAVVRRLRPWAVDVSSGVEQSIGLKSLDKMRRFVIAVYEADQPWSD
jgi:phosphoribosylanthranilate isomerase